MSKKRNRSLVIAGLAAAPLLAACAAGRDAPPAAASAPAGTVYACSHRGSLQGFGGTLEFDMVFAKDGAVLSDKASWYTHFDPPDRETDEPETMEGLVEAPSARVFIGIRWPQAFSWLKLATGKDPVAYAEITSSNSALYDAPFRGAERWHQLIIVRGGEAAVDTEIDDRFLLLNPAEPVLASDYHHRSGVVLDMPIEALLAWGSSLRTLAVYDVFVEPREYQPNSSPTSPAAKRRIVGEYRLRVAAVARAYAAMRKQHAVWRRGLKDYKANCKAGRMEGSRADFIPYRP